jgi:hypothetical protein
MTTTQSEGRDAPAALLSRLTGDAYDGYLRQPIPAGSDADPSAVVEAYLEANPEERATILDAVTEDAAEILEIFAEREAVVAVRCGSLEPIRFGLLATGMAIPHSDYRCVLIGLSKLDHSAQLLGTDLRNLFEEVRFLLPEATRDFIDRFLARDDRGPSLIKSMGYGTYGSGNEFIYENASPYDDDEAEEE